MVSSAARILVVDDEEIIRVLLGHALAEYELTLSDSCRIALEELARGPFDAVVTDKNLPDGDGSQICQAARRANPNCVLVVLTGYATSRSAEEFLRLDVDDYIAKPFDINHLQTRLAAALELRRGARVARKAAKPVDGRSVLLVEPEESDRSALRRVLERLGCTIVESADATAALEANATLAGAVLNRRLCTADVKAAIMRRKMENPDFRLVVTVENRALNETVASILVGAVGQLARPIGEDDARTTLAAVFGPAN